MMWADPDNEEMYREAVRVVVDAGEVSIPHLQRQMRIGYGCAAGLVDMMEEDGIVSTRSGGKPREVLVGRHHYQGIDKAREA